MRADLLMDWTDFSSYGDGGGKARERGGSPLIAVKSRSSAADHTAGRVGVSKTANEVTLAVPQVEVHDHIQGIQHGSLLQGCPKRKLDDALR